VTTYKTAVEFGTNVGVLERDYARAATASRTFGTEATASLKTATVAEDQLALASQRVVAAQAQLTASRERLNAVMASGVATQRELAVAQTSFVASQERLLAAQTKQAELARVSQVTAVPSQRGALGGIGGLVGALVATEGAIKIKNAVENGVRVASQLQAIDRQVNVTLTSTGNVAGTSADHIDHVAESLARVTGIMPNTIAGGQLLELTFTGIRNEGAGTRAIFDRTAQAAANMAIGLHLARGGAIDYQGVMQMLARALNNPIQGMTALSRAGISFTQQQREQISALAKNGQLLQAQALILDLVNKKYGDAGRQFGQTAEGGLDRMRVALDDFEKSLASPALIGGVPILHAITDTLAFMTAHPMTIWATETITALIGVAFTLAALQRAMAFLKESQWATAFLRVLFPLRSLQRQLGVLTVEEDAQAASAARSAEANNLNAAAMERAALAARQLAGAQAATDVTSAAGPGGAAGLLARLGLGGAEGTAIGAPELLLAGALGVGAFAGTTALLHHFFGKQFGKDPVKPSAQLTGAGKDLVNQYGGLDQAIAALRGLSGETGHYATELARTGQVVLTVAGHHELLTAKLVAERDATYQADLADANTAQARAGRLQKAYQTAKLLQRQVTEGYAKAIQTVEGMIGVPAAGLFDLVNPNDTAARAASTASGVQSAQASTTSAQRAISTAEARLESLRTSGKATASQLISAENSLANARDRSRLASDRLSAAEQKAHDIRSQALSITDVLKRAEDQVTNDQSQTEAARRLVDMGISEPVLQGLLALDQQAPGTFARVAANITQAGVDELNRDQRLKDAARRGLEDAFSAANTKDARKAAAHGASLAAQAWQQAYLAAIRDPKFWDLINTDLGQLLLPPGVLPKGNPGAGGVPGGKAPSLGGFLGFGLPGGGGRHGHGAVPHGVSMGVTSGVTGAPNVIVHVHTSAPQYTSTNEVNLHGAQFHDTKSWDQFEQRQRARASMP
jgi:hypothetical protein